MNDDRSDRMYPSRPLVGVGAVVWDGSRILLERRGQPPMQDAWALPGGLIELGESAEDALVREVREECALEVRPGPILGLFEPIQRDPDGRIRYHYVVIDFLAYYVSGDPAFGDDAAEVRWVNPEDLDEYKLTTVGRQIIARALEVIAAQQG